MLDVGDEAQGQQHGPQVKAQTLGGKEAVGSGVQIINRTTSRTSSSTTTRTTSRTTTRTTKDQQKHFYANVL